MKYEMKMYIGEQAVKDAGAVYACDFNALNRLAVIEVQLVKESCLFFVDTAETQQRSTPKATEWEVNVMLPDLDLIQWTSEARLFWQCVASMDSAVKKYLRAVEESALAPHQGTKEILTGVMAGMGWRR